MNIHELVSIGESLVGIPRSALDEADGKFPPSIYYKFFELIATKYQPNISVVLGVCGGGDCWHLAKGNPTGKVIGVDIAYDHPEQLEYIEANCQNFSFHLGDSTESAPFVSKRFGSINFLFIDSAHTYDQAMAEFEAWKPFLANGAIVCFDDLFRTEMVGVWEALPEPKTRMDWLHDGTPDVGGGFGVLIHTPNPMQSETGYEDRM